MTPTERALLRALALSNLAPGSGVLRDGVREALAGLDAEAARAVNAPRPPADTVVAEVRADLLARSEAGIAKYGVTLDRTDLGPREWLDHLRQELMDAVLYATRALRDLPAATPTEPPRASGVPLAPLAPEPTPAVLGRACEALNGSPPVYVMAGTGRHPYGDDAYWAEGRIFPNKDFANAWLRAMGKVPV
jgi:hypothetical protein